MRRVGERTFHPFSFQTSLFKLTPPFQGPCIASSSYSSQVGNRAFMLAQALSAMAGEGA